MFIKEIRIRYYREVSEILIMSAFINDYVLKGVFHMQKVYDLLVIIEYSPICDVVQNLRPEQQFDRKHIRRKTFSG
jgi:hypothetical protein